jgi:hypothetical protein
MSDQESDFEVDVTDLNTGTTVRDSLDEHSVTAEQDAQGSPLRRMQPPTRCVRAMIVASVTLLAVLLIVLLDPALRASLATALRPSPAASPTLPPDANLVFLESGAPWGAFSLDGLVTYPLVQPGTRVSSVWIRLTPNRHTLQVSQPPFASLNCSISLPAARSDTCPIVSPEALRDSYFGNQSELPPNSRVIDLGARFARLPPDIATALVDAVRARVSLPAVAVAIMAGDHYLRDDGSVAVAQTPLQIALQPDLTPPDRSVPSDSARCQSFCDVLTNSQDGNRPGGMWSLAVAQQGSWRVTTADGRIIANHAPLWPSASPYDTLSSDVGNLHMNFNVRWDGTWHTLSQNDFTYGDLSPSLPAVANQMTNALLSASSTVDTSTTNVYEGRGVDAGRGWVITLTLRDPATTTPLILYYHFGALLAVNGAAHRAFPSLPVASTNEQALARAIMGTP